MEDPGTADLLARTAGAPISWGVCEVPGWGHQMAAERVLTEMREVGLRAAEFGPAGFLPDDPGERAAALARYGLRAVGGFVPVVAHEAGHDVLAELAPVLDAHVAAGATTLVLAADTGAAGYDQRVVLDGAGWLLLLRTLDLVADAAAQRGVTAVLHPHVGTVVERADEVDRVLDGCSVPLCLDTGHLLIGGVDPAALAADAPGRIAHAHLKDVDAGLAERVRSGGLGYADAVAAGLYRPLGAGDVDVAGAVRALEGAGYRGWYVLEQDAVLGADPPPGGGPVGDVRASLAHLAAIATRTAPTGADAAEEGVSA